MSRVVMSFGGYGSRMAEIRGETIELVRHARGFTQDELASAAGVSQGYLSQIEKGRVEPDEARLAALAAALQVDTRVLSEPLVQSGAGCTHFRKRASVKVFDTKRLRADLALRTFHIERLAALVELPRCTLRPESPSEDGFITAEEIASEVRAALGISSGPIVDLVGSLDKAGCVIVFTELPALAFDAASTWTSGRKHVVMLVNSARPTDRMRFSVAHELGHAVMHQSAAPGTEAETEADEFASEFLMPATEIAAELRGLSFERLPTLKLRWRVSMAALVRRAHDLAVISPARYRSLMIELSKAGYRTFEPHPLHPQPTPNPGALRAAWSRHRQKSVRRKLPAVWA